MERCLHDAIAPLLAILSALLIAAGVVGAALAPAVGPAPGGIPTTPDPGGIRLDMTLWPHGPAAPAQQWTLRCPSPHPACAADVAALLDEDVPRAAHCRGPAPAGIQEAVAVGWINGRHHAAFFEHRTQCDAARWRRARALLAPPDDIALTP